MKALAALYHFLGSVYFALLIILLMAFVAAAGTFTESYTQSHQYAALFTYSNPLFYAILAALFLNILIAALRRWPFRPSHTPFLMTHLGLLMLIGGVAVKNLWGIQGNMALPAGGSSQSIAIPHTQVIRVEKRHPSEPSELVAAEYPVTSSFMGKGRRLGPPEGDPLPELTLEIAGYSPHCEEHWESWIKGDQGCIAGLTPFPAYSVEDIPISTRVKLFRGCEEVWDIFAAIGGDPEKILKSISGNIPLRREDPFEATSDSELRTTPKLLIFKGDDQTVTLYAIDRYGHLAAEKFPSKEISPLIVYNEGFGGYFANLTLPFPAYPYDFQTLKEAKIHRIAKELRHQHFEPADLSPPLQLLYHACKKTKTDFAYTLAHLYLNAIPPDVSKTLSQLDWPLHRGDSPSANEKNLSLFLAALELYGIDLNFFAPSLSKDEAKQCLLEYLRDISREAKLTNAFPPLKALPFQQKIAVLKELIPQHETIRQLLPESTLEDALPTFSRPDLWEGLEAALLNEAIALETPITPVYSSSPPTDKLEENRPNITLLAKYRGKQQYITLAYDPMGQGLKWPILHGEYRLSFQSQTVKIPSAIRLHDARQINYPNSHQPLSYEADLLLPSEGVNGSAEKLTTISMNHVYESPEGYRFYLANLTPGDESAVQQVQLAVNYDPAKYTLTYPGALLITLGTALLLWFRSKKAG